MHHKRKNKRLIVIAILLLLISIGFAYLTSTLEMDGLAGVKGNTWKIYFDNVEVYKGASLATTAPTTTGTNTTDLEYSVTLNKPGDVYKFYVDIVNAGSLDAMVHLVKKTNLTAEQKKYIHYTVTYADETPIEPLNLLAKKNGNNPTRDTIVVTVEYKKDVAEEDLPTTADVTVTQKLHLDYRQANSSAEARTTTQPTVTYDWNYNFVKNGDIIDSTDGWINDKNATLNVDENIRYNGKPTLHIYTSQEDWSGIYQVLSDEYYSHLDKNKFKMGGCIYKDSTHELGGVTQRIRYYISFNDTNSVGQYIGFGLGSGSNWRQAVSEFAMEKEWSCFERNFQVTTQLDSSGSLKRIRFDQIQEHTNNNFWLANIYLRIYDKYQYTYNTAISSFPTNPTREGYTFDGWYTDPYGGTQVTTALVVRESQTLYAHWS